MQPKKKATMRRLIERVENEEEEEGLKKDRLLSGKTRSRANLKYC